jgi:hypothetical protein
MTFILPSDFGDGSPDPQLLNARFAAYREYLYSVSEELPASAYEFAIADWHYDPNAHQCPHDAWVERLTISELSSGTRQQHRSIQIVLELLAAYHDSYIQLTYKDVQMYAVNAPPGFKLPPLGVGHGDWLTDEIRLSERGMVLHEIEFSRGSRWLIEAMDIQYEWKPIQ